MAKRRSRKYWRTRRQIEAFIRNIPPLISGRVQPKGTAERRVYNAFWSAVTKRFFEELYKAYEQKSQSYADDNGETWMPLAPETKAYKRRGDRNKLLTGSQKRKLHNPDTPGLLTPSQYKRWAKTFAKVYAREVKKNAGQASPSTGKYLTKGKYKKFLKENRGNKVVPEKGMTDEAAKSKAAAVAWADIKARGAETLIGALGNQPMDIMIRTGTLIKSLKPGTINGSLKYVKGDKYQVVRNGPGYVFIGTSVPYAHFASRTIQPSKSRPFAFKREYIPSQGEMGVFLDRAMDSGRDAFAKELRELITKNKSLQ
jgi:hypothetical protein